MGDTMSLSNCEWKETEIGRMPADWEMCSIGEIADVTKLAGFEYTDHFTYTQDGEIIALRALNVRDGVLDLTDVQRIKKEVSDTLIRSKLFKGDILFTYVGANIGQFALVPEDNKYHLAPNICRIRVSKRTTPYFLYSYFRTRPFKENLENFSVGSSQPTMPMGNIRQIKVPVPSFNEQVAIASILISLDDKIDLLHRQNKTLEALAETLFRQWFVEEADESWEEKSIGDVADHIKDSVSPAKTSESYFYHYSIPAFDEVREPRLEIGSSILSNKYKVPSDCILVSKLNPRVSRIWGLYGQIDELKSICSTEFQIVKPKGKQWYSFIYCFLKSKPVTNELAGASGGTSGSHQRVDPKVIFDLSFLKPDKTILENFNIITSNYWEKIKSNNKHIRTLTQLRDTLLPKLMSGEVRVKI